MMDRLPLFMMVCIAFAMIVMVIYPFLPFYKECNEHDLIQKRVKELYIEYKACELVEKMFSEQTE